MLNSITVADVLRPAEKKYAAIYDVTVILAASLVIAVCAQIAVSIPFSPVPVTAQTFAVLIIGALLGAKRGSLAVLAYIGQGAAGLPVFAMARSGIGVLVGPTGGYLVGFIAAAFITGFLAQRGFDRKPATTVGAMLLGNCVIYAFGIFWLACLVGFKPTVFAVGLYPFIVGDIVKIALAAALLPAGWKLLKTTNLPT